MNGCKMKTKAIVVIAILAAAILAALPHAAA
jgi:hypothetical protein